MDAEQPKHEGNTRNRRLTFAEATDTVLDNMPLLVCGLVMTLALVHEWI